VATGTTVFSRVTVVAPRTRIDVALPADVAIADLLPMLLDMAKEATPDGGARHGGWCLAKLGDVPLDPSRTLASLGVVDGDLLQLRRRSDNPPPPLYDDVVDAIAESTPSSFRPWTKDTAHRIGHVAAALTLILAAVAVLLAGPLVPGGNGIAAAVAAGVATLLAITVGATITHAYDAKTTGVVISAAGALPMAFVCGVYVVPGSPGAANLLLGCVFVLIISAAAIMVVGTGVTVFVGAGTASGLGAIAFLVATVIDESTAGIAAGAAAVALAALSILPRITILLAKLPLPSVPRDAEDLREDSGFPDFRVIERRTGLAHEYMTGMIIGCGVTAAVSAVLAASGGDMWGVVEGGAVSAVLLLRGRTYANGAQAIALLLTGMLTAAGLLIGWTVESTSLHRLLYVFAALLVIAAGTLLIGIVFPDQRFSPVLRRSVDTLEAVLIVSVLPLALAVMGLYSSIRHVHFG
jgi:type VII secretion integral membrane protein EccD